MHQVDARGDVATRADLAVLRGDFVVLRGDFAELRADFAELRQTTRADTAELRQEMQVGFAKMHEEMAHLETRFERRFGDLIKWSFVFWVGAVGAVAVLAGVLR